MAFRAINPVTGAELASYPRTPANQVAGLIDAAQRAQAAWAELEIAARAESLRTAAQLLRQRASPLALLMADEMGKPVGQGRDEAKKCADALDHFALHATRYLAPELITAERPRREVRYEPRGVVLGIMPWNFPLWQIVRFVAPALMAGNACLVKPAPNVPGCALALQAIFAQAELPDSLYTNLLIPESEVADVIAHPAVRGITLTGSVRAGQAVATVAAQHIKPCILELGGSDAYLVLDDADLEDAVEACASSRLFNSGQSCIAAKRWIVHDHVAAAFEERVVRYMGGVRVGPPREPDVQVGPMARVDLRDALHRQVTASRMKGARVVIGGDKPHGPSAFYPVTLVTDVSPGMPLYDEETFGPVAVLLRASNDEEAIAIANGTPFGLGAAVFSRKDERAAAVAARLEAGTVAINAVVHSDPRVPFGGVKQSGYGRELGNLGIRALTVAKTYIT